MLFPLLSCCFYYLVPTPFTQLLINCCFCSLITPPAAEFLPSSCSDGSVTALATPFPLYCYLCYPGAACPMLLLLRWCLDIASAAQLLLSRYSVTALAPHVLLRYSIVAVLAPQLLLLLLRGTDNYFRRPGFWNLSWNTSTVFGIRH